MSVAMQKQTARNLVLSPNSQAAEGGVLADAALSYRASVDASTVFANSDKRYSDQNAIGHGTDFATVDVRTSLDTACTIKGMGGTEAWLLGWMLAFAFGQEVVSGPGPYTHNFTIPTITSQMPCTTAYVEDTNDVHRKYADMAAKSLSIDVPERGPIQGSLDMVGTGKYFPGSFSTALPPIATPTYLLGSDLLCTITPAGGGATPFNGRQTGMSLKVDRGSAPFEASGDGLTAGSVQAGQLKFSLDLTIMAVAADDVNGWFENMTPLNVSVATSAGLPYQLGFNFPMSRFKTRKLGNKDDKVAWQLSLDQSSILQVGNAPALTAYIINGCPGYLIPA